MADQAELTTAAIMDRLEQDSVPKRIVADDTVEYYLWLITDDQLHKYLTPAQYGLFEDGVNDFYSVTTPPDRRKGRWVFAPSEEFIDWLTDQEISNELKLAYVKLVNVEESFDEEEYPSLVALKHAGSKKLYAYPYLSIMSANNLVSLSLNERPEDDDVSIFDQVDEQYRKTQPKEVDEFEADGEAPEVDDIFASSDEGEFKDDLGADPLIDEADSLEDEGEFGMEPDEGPVDFESAEEDEEIPFESEEPTPIDFEADEGASTPDNSLPRSLEHMVAQISSTPLKEPTIRVDSGLEDYHEQVNDIRQQLNDQLENLTETAKQRLVSKYFERRSVAEASIDAKLDPETGDPKVVAAYQSVQTSNDQDLADLNQIEAEKRQELVDKLPEYKKEFIQEAIAKAESDWEAVKEARYIEAPIQKWREGVSSTVDSHRDERQRRFDDWRNQIKKGYLAKVDTPILNELSHEVSGIVAELKQEQENARQELNRSQERLFNQSLELERLKIRRQSSANVYVPQKPVEDTETDFEEIPDSVANTPEVTPEDLSAAYEPVDEDDEFELDTETTPTPVAEEDPLVDDDDEEEFSAENLGDVSVEPEPETPIADALDDDDLDDFFGEEEEESSQKGSTDALRSKDTDADALDLEDLDLDDFDFGEDDEPSLKEELTDTDDFSLDDVEDEKPKPKTKIDDYVGDTHNDLSEQAIIDQTLDDFDDEEDEVEEAAPKIGRGKSKSKAKSKKSKSKKDKSAKTKRPKQPKTKKDSNKDDKEPWSLKKKLLVYGGGGFAGFIVLWIVLAMLFGGGGSSLKVSPSATNTYTTGNMLTGKKDGKDVALVIESVNGNKLTVKDVSSGKSYTVEKPSAN